MSATETSPLQTRFYLNTWTWRKWCEILCNLPSSSSKRSVSHIQKAAQLLLRWVRLRRTDLCPSAPHQEVRHRAVQELCSTELTRRRHLSKRDATELVCSSRRVIILSPSGGFALELFSVCVQRGCFVAGSFLSVLPKCLSWACSSASAMGCLAEVWGLFVLEQRNVAISYPAVPSWQLVLAHHIAVSDSNQRLFIRVASQHVIIIITWNNNYLKGSTVSDKPENIPWHLPKLY